MKATTLTPKVPLFRLFSVQFFNLPAALAICSGTIGPLIFKDPILYRVNIFFSLWPSLFEGPPTYLLKAGFAGPANVAYYLQFFHFFKASCELFEGRLCQPPQNPTLPQARLCRACRCSVLSLVFSRPALSGLQNPTLLAAVDTSNSNRIRR